MNQRVISSKFKGIVPKHSQKEIICSSEASNMHTIFYIGNEEMFLNYKIVI